MAYNNNYQKSRSNDRSDNRVPAIPFFELKSEDYVEKAEKVINTLERDNSGKSFKLTTSQIRNLLAMTSEMLNKVNNCKASGDEKMPISAALVQDLNALKIRAVYECGRTPPVRELIENAHVLEHIKRIKSVSDCELFCHYMEALVAYHRFLGGKD